MRAGPGQGGEEEAQGCSSTADCQAETRRRGSRSRAAAWTEKQPRPGGGSGAAAGRWQLRADSSSPLLGEAGPGPPTGSHRLAPHHKPAPCSGVVG